jgi:hypothetical protein
MRMRSRFSLTVSIVPRRADNAWPDTLWDREDAGRAGAAALASLLAVLRGKA